MQTTFTCPHFVRAFAIFLDYSTIILSMNLNSTVDHQQYTALAVQDQTENQSFVVKIREIIFYSVMF